MIKVEKVETWGFEHAIRGMRNPYDSWDKSDSVFNKTFYYDETPELDYEICDLIGDNDLSLMKRLYRGGSEHRKYLRQVFVSMDITAPLYWWKEFDTYKVGTVANSCSTMHTIHKKEFTLDDFSIGHVVDEPLDVNSNNGKYWNRPLDALIDLVDILNSCRQKYLETKDKNWWWQLIQLLPSSYNQKRTVTMNYENVVTIIHQRSGHKLDEWNDFIRVLKDLPYIEDIMDE